MVNIVIYLNEKFDSKELVENLLSEKLIASAFIDVNNVSYMMSDDKLQECVYNVITAQSKSLLFGEIVKYVENRYDETVPMNAVPIIASNNVFNDLIFNRTLKV